MSTVRVARRVLGASALGVALLAGVSAAPAAAESRTVPDGVGDVDLYDRQGGPGRVVDRAEVDLVGASVRYDDPGIHVEVFTRAPAPSGVVVTHRVYLQGTEEGEHHLLLVRSNRPDVDVVTDGGPDGYRIGPCPGVRRSEAGTRITVDVPRACLPLLGAETRFRIDSTLWDPPYPTLPSDQWWDRLPAEGGFSLHRGPRPASAPAPEVDGPVHDPASLVGQVDRLYRAALGRPPDAAGLAHWLRAVWTGYPLHQVATDVAASAEFAARYGTAADGDLIDLVYRAALGRQPDPDGRAWWLDRLRRGLPRGVFVFELAQSPEHVARTAGLRPPGSRAA